MRNLPIQFRERPVKRIECDEKNHYNRGVSGLVGPITMIVNILTGCLGVALFFTLGCSTAPTKWYKAGVGQETFSRDKAACEDSLLNTGTTGYSAQVYTFEGCMEAKGYMAIPESPE